MFPRPGSDNRVAIVGASSLRGKELKQVLEDRNFPASDIVLLDESVMAGTLTEASGEPTFIRALEEGSFEGAKFAFFAGSPSDAARNWPVAQSASATVIDLTGAVNSSERSKPRIPSIVSALPPRAISGSNGSAEPAPYFSPPTPVIVACTVAAGLLRFMPQRLVLLLFPPVSERDQAGVEELESQSASLLSFRPIAQTIFDAQVAFSLLWEYGEASKPSLSETSTSISQEVSRYIGGRAPVPAIQLVQAPVFYGCSFSAYAEFAAPVAANDLESEFANLGVKIAAPDDPPPTNVSVAGESQIHLGRIKADASIASAVWLWGVADNLRLAATNAVRIAEELLEKHS